MSPRAVMLLWRHRQARLKARAPARKNGRGADRSAKPVKKRLNYLPHP